jgi:hypothetical protein
MLADMGLTGKIQVGNSDAGFYFNNKVLAAIDYGVRLFLQPIFYMLTHDLLRSSFQTCIPGSAVFPSTMLQVGLGISLMSPMSSQLHAFPTTLTCT